MLFPYESQIAVDKNNCSKGFGHDQKRTVNPWPQLPLSIHN